MTNRYTHGLIYQIRLVHEPRTVLYIGSTCNLTKRRNDHKSTHVNINSSAYNRQIYKKIRSIGGWGFIKIEKLYDYSCQSKAELLAEEDRKIKEIGIKNLYNDKSAHGTDKERRKEWLKDNQDKVKAIKKKYNDANKDKSKVYYEENKDKILEDRRIYRETHKDEIAARKKRYYDQNKAKIREVRGAKEVCQCGGEYSKQHRARHMRSKKHQSYIADNN